MTAATDFDLPLAVAGWTYVYVHRNADNDILYIGSTVSLRARTRAHERTAAWWPDVATIEHLGPYPSRREALDVEARLIRETEPPNNVAHTPRNLGRYYPPKPRPAVKQAEQAVRDAAAALRLAERQLARARREANKTAVPPPGGPPGRHGSTQKAQQ